MRKSSQSARSLFSSVQPARRYFPPGSSFHLLTSAQQTQTAKSLSMPLSVPMPDKSSNLHPRGLQSAKAGRRRKAPAKSGSRHPTAPQNTGKGVQEAVKPPAPLSIAACRRRLCLLSAPHRPERLWGCKGDLFLFCKIRPPFRREAAAGRLQLLHSLRRHSGKEERPPGRRRLPERESFEESHFPLPGQIPAGGQQTGDSLPFPDKIPCLCI